MRSICDNEAVSGNESLSSEPTIERRTCAIYFALVSLMIIFGNVLTICVVRKKKRKKPTDLLLGVLAATDLITPILVFPLVVVYGLADSWIGGKATCYMTAFLSMFLFKFSMLLASLVAIDRFLAISKPFFYRSNVLIRPARFAVGLTGLYSACTALIPFVGMVSRDDGACITDWSLCLYHWSATRGAPTAARVYVILCTIDTTLTIAAVLICNIGVVVYFIKRRHQRSKNVVPVANSKVPKTAFKWQLPRNSIQRKSDMKYAKIMVVVSCYFPLCFLPVQIVIALHYLGDTSMEAGVIVYFQLHMGVVSLLLNPLLHAFIRKHYRRAYWFIVKHPRVLCEAFNGEFDFDGDFRDASEFERKQLTLRELTVTALATTRFKSHVKRARAINAEKAKAIPTIVKRDFSHESEADIHPNVMEGYETTPMNLRARREFRNRSISWTSSYFSDHDLESQPPSPGILSIPECSFKQRPRISSDCSDSDKVTICTEVQTTTGPDRTSLDGDVFESISSHQDVQLPTNDEPYRLPPLHSASAGCSTQHGYRDTPPSDNSTTIKKTTCANKGQQEQVRLNNSKHHKMTRSAKIEH